MTGLPPFTDHDGWPVSPWTPYDDIEPPADVLAAEAIPDVRRPCGDRHCGRDGLFVPKGEPHFDADGSAMIGLVCAHPQCTVESCAYWDWNGTFDLDDDDEDDEDWL